MEEERERTMKGRCYERKKCVHGGKEMFKEQYPPANIYIWIRNLDMDMNKAQSSRVYAVETDDKPVC